MRRAHFLDLVSDATAIFWPNYNYTLRRAVHEAIINKPDEVLNLIWAELLLDHRDVSLSVVSQDKFSGPCTVREIREYVIADYVMQHLLQKDPDIPQQEARRAEISAKPILSFP